MKKRNALIIFAKSPESSNVKTRLSERLDDAERLALYTSLLENTVEKLREIPDVETLISYTGEGEYFRKFGIPMFRQSDGDLGRRMYHDMKKVLAAGHEKAVLVGVDIPDLGVEIIMKAFDLLSESDAVFGPARDGGYYLVGLKSPVDSIFSGIEWSTENTLRQTLDNAESAGLKVSFTDTLSDIDRPEDLDELKE